ncbi:MAG: cytidylate kinase family protein [Chloroflexota bacterium]
MRVITISGEIATGTSTLAAAVVEQQPGWRLSKTGDRFREYCQDHGLSLLDVGSLPDEVHRAFDLEQRAMLEHEQQLVVEGRLAGWLARDLPDVFRVFCHAPLSVRVARYAQREHADDAQSLADIQHRDRGDREKYRQVYSLRDYRAHSFYQLILSTAKASPRELAEAVAHRAGLAS